MSKREEENKSSPGGGVDCVSLGEAGRDADRDADRDTDFFASTLFDFFSPDEKHEKQLISQPTKTRPAQLPVTLENFSA